MNDFRLYSDTLEHHGIDGMKWGQRNGPPYPLKSFQKRAGDAVAKGKAALAKATNSAGKTIVRVYRDQSEKSKARAAEARVVRAEKAEIARAIRAEKRAEAKARKTAKVEEARAKKEAKIAEEKARKQAEKDENARRLAEAARTKKLLELYEKNPDLLSYQELSDLNNRMFQMKKINENYSIVSQKTSDAGKSAVEKTKNVLVSDVIKPGVVAIGKAALFSAVGGGDFKKIASVQLDKTFNGSNQNKNKDKNKEDDEDRKKKFSGFEFKVKREYV